MRRAPIALVSLLWACSASHDPGPTSSDASMPDAVVAIPDAGAPDAPEVVVAGDAGAAPDAPPPEPDAGVIDLGDPSCAPEEGEPPRFRDLYAEVISAHACADCHGGSSWPGTTTLDLTTAEIAYRSLVNVLGCDEVRDRVTPCEPDESTLSVVPTLREEPCGGRHTFGDGSVTEAEGARIDEWIRLGAHW